MLFGISPLTLILANSPPTSAMDSRIGPSLRPKTVSAYSTVGGEVCFTSLVTTPRFSNSFRRVVKTLAEIRPRSLFKSQNRLSSVLKYQRIWGVQAPANSFKLVSKGQPWGTGPDLFGLWRIIILLLNV